MYGTYIATLLGLAQNQGITHSSSTQPKNENEDTQYKSDRQFNAMQQPFNLFINHLHYNTGVQTKN
jgi:hypothetical protein